MPYIAQLAVVVKNRVTPKWLALGGHMDQNLRPGSWFHFDPYPVLQRPEGERKGTHAGSWAGAAEKTGFLGAPKNVLVLCPQRTPAKGFFPVEKRPDPFHTCKGCQRKLTHRLDIGNRAVAALGAVSNASGFRKRIYQPCAQKVMFSAKDHKVVWTSWILK